MSVAKKSLTGGANSTMEASTAKIAFGDNSGDGEVALQVT